jgi:predicted ATP-dependent protease
MLWERAGIDLSRLHIHFQVRSLLEGAPGQGVSGPSAGLAMALALLSELSNLPLSPAIVSTGTIGVKLDVGPVGGLGGYGTQTGKVLGILRSQKVKITTLILPASNAEIATDEMRILQEEGVTVCPVRNVSGCVETMFGVSEAELGRKIKESVEKAATLTQRN